MSAKSTDLEKTFLFSSQDDCQYYLFANVLCLPINVLCQKFYHIRQKKSFGCLGVNNTIGHCIQVYLLIFSISLVPLGVHVDKATYNVHS